jgi:hypothetical protein
MQIFGDSYRIVTPDAGELKGNETKIFLPEEYKKYDELQLNQTHFEFALDRKIIDLLVGLFEIILVPAKKDEKKDGQQQDKRDIFRGKEVVIEKYYKSLKGE